MMMQVGVVVVVLVVLLDMLLTISRVSHLSIKTHKKMNLFFSKVYSTEFCESWFHASGHGVFVSSGFPVSSCRSSIEPFTGAESEYFDFKNAVRPFPCAAKRALMDKFHGAVGHVAHYIESQSLVNQNAQKNEFIFCRTCPGTLPVSVLEAL